MTMFAGLTWLNSTGWERPFFNHGLGAVLTGRQLVADEGNKHGQAS
jgi:hypothetical protein